MTESLYGATAPVFTVDDEIRGELARDVVRLEVEEDTEGLRTMVLRLVAQGPWPDRSTDEDLGYLDGGIIDFGSSIEVSIGLSENEQTIFRGLVSGLEVDLEEGREPHGVVFAEDGGVGRQCDGEPSSGRDRHRASVVGSHLAAGHLGVIEPHAIGAVSGHRPAAANQLEFPLDADRIRGRKDASR